MLPLWVRVDLRSMAMNDYPYSSPSDGLISYPGRLKTFGADKAKIENNYDSVSDGLKRFFISYKIYRYHFS